MQIPIFKMSASAGDIMTNDRSGTQMGQTAKSYCQDWLKSKIYERRKEFTSKQTAKGNYVEMDAIELVAKHLGYSDYDRNDEYFENDFVKGVPDYITKDSVIDIKVSWDCFTFPLFETEIPNKNYFYQGQVYMWLTGLNEFKLAYTLMDAPEFIIKQQAIYYCRNNNVEVTPDIFEKFKVQMSYSHLPAKDRVKIFTIQKNDAVIQQIQNRVLQCREYIDQLVVTIK